MIKSREVAAFAQLNRDVREIGNLDGLADLVGEQRGGLTLLPRGEKAFMQSPVAADGITDDRRGAQHGGMLPAVAEHFHFGGRLGLAVDAAAVAAEVNLHRAGVLGRRGADATGKPKAQHKDDGPSHW